MPNPTKPTVDTTAADAWRQRWPEAAELLGQLLHVTVECDDDDWLFMALAMAGHAQAAAELEPIWQGGDDTAAQSP
jgi:hypothetical protein